ncbi:hypothetical protein RO3G_14708 [Rhizopus delemar RA 99-880]|uniref:Uncharacterized protein n=1 Tax=Rhizopus delemar (strain RA 99-880 / ATCC MYA-4621 / FGSC 9543 / NRRL 43880) TaxID=246409 RepID=I1CNG7_RHIO9|nr:hypothetical protein RO3G_14708 [Rhizopus delemar RA 99-880]|eukprot:EIE89997.1 hypothetical protein RO3G_14708 [Rhizopus delemar RA 99-880]
MCNRKLSGQCKRYDARGFRARYLYYSSVTSYDANNFSAFNGGIFEGVTVLPDELQAFKDEKITWLTVNGGYGVIADRILPVFKTYTQLSMHLMILQRTMIRMKRPQ